MQNTDITAMRSLLIASLAPLVNDSIIRSVASYHDSDELIFFAETVERTFSVSVIEDVEWEEHVSFYDEPCDEFRDRPHRNVDVANDLFGAEAALSKLYIEWFNNAT